MPGFSFGVSRPGFILKSKTIIREPYVYYFAISQLDAKMNPEVKNDLTTTSTDKTVKTIQLQNDLATTSTDKTTTIGLSYEVVVA